MWRKNPSSRNICLSYVNHVFSEFRPPVIVRIIKNVGNGYIFLISHLFKVFNRTFNFYLYLTEVLTLAVAIGPQFPSSSSHPELGRLHPAVPGHDNIKIVQANSGE